MTAARIALDAHTGLHEILKHPPDALVRSLDHYLTMGREFIAEHREGDFADLSGDERAVFKSWDYYNWPAQTGRDLIRLWATPLFSAPTYQVTGEIVQAVTGMYRTTADGEPVLRASDMPSQTGFAWLDESVTLDDFSGARIAIRAISWGPQRFSPEGVQPARGVRVTSWAEDGLEALHSRDAAGVGSSSSVFVPYGRPVSAGTSDDPTRWLHCLWLFMDTEITQAARERADRGSRRRAEHAGLHGDVTVVMLRRRHYTGEAGHRDIDWSCRWVVQGHERHLGDYRAEGYEPHHAKPLSPGQPCAVCGMRTTHVRAYVKGPDGLPLKPSAVVYRVSR